MVSNVKQWSEFWHVLRVVFGVSVAHPCALVQVGVLAVICAAVCLGCQRNSRRHNSDPYTPGSNKKNLLGRGSRRGSSSGDYAMVAIDEGHATSDSEDGATVGRDEKGTVVARVLTADYDDESGTKKKQQEAAPEISTDFLVQDSPDGNVDDWLQAEPPKKQKIKVDYSSYD